LIHGVVILHKSGIPILWKSFQEEKKENESTLVAGLLSALSSFSKQVFGETFQKLEFENLELILSPISNRNLLLGIVSTKDDPAATILINYLIPPLNAFFNKFKNIMDTQEYNSQQIQEELSEIIESHTTRVVAPTFSEIQSLLKHIYPNIIGVQDFESYLEFKKEMKRITEIALRNLNIINSQLQKMIFQQQEKKNHKKIIEHALNEFDKLNFKKCLSSLLSCIDNTYYGNLAKLLYAKVSTIAVYYGSRTDIPSELLLKQLISSVPEKEKLSLIRDVVFDYVRAYCSNNPAMLFGIKPLLAKYDDELVNAINSERDPLSKRIFYYLVMPLGFYLRNTNKVLIERFERKSVFIEWCKALEEIDVDKEIIYSTKNWDEIAKLLANAKNQYLSSKEMLFNRQSKKHDDLQNLFLHLLNVYKYMFRLFIALGTRNISIKDKKQIIDEIIALWDAEREFLFEIKELNLPIPLMLNIFLWSLSSILFLEGLISPTELKNKAHNMKLIIESVLQTMIEARASMRLSKGLYQLFVINIFPVVAGYLEYTEIQKVYIIQLVNDLLNINSQDFEELRKSDYLLYLTSIANFIIGLSTIAKLQAREADRIYIAKRSIEFLSRLARIFLLSGRVINTIFIAIMKNYEILAELSDINELINIVKSAERSAKSLLANPEIDILSKSKILQTLAKIQEIASIQLKKNNQLSLANDMQQKAIKTYNELIVTLTLNKFDESILEYYINERKKLLNYS